MARIRRNRCKICGKTFTREDMVKHIERKHMDVMPEGFTPLRATFHMVNGKDFNYRRLCRICKQPTEWDEKKGRYNFLCGKPSCHEAWVKEMKNTMGDKYGKFRPTENPEGLQKMLDARKISGTYKFKDGGEKSYTGSYERKALEFMDKILELNSEDIQTPGPILQYELDGNKHYYIPDIYYIPYNLIIEVKDGGDNKNGNKAMAEVRRKSIAKERFVIEKTDYNYLRLTNNDFSQLLAVFADIKMSLIDPEIEDKRIWHVNEDAGFSAPMIGAVSGVVVVNYLKNNAFASPEIAISDNIRLDNLVTVSGANKLIKKQKDFLNDCTYELYEVNVDKDKLYTNILENMGKVVYGDYLYREVFGHERYDNDQIKFEESAKPLDDFYNKISNMDKIIKEGILNG